ncbi:MAG: A24 family peptidase [Acidithiobacillus sp.]
MNLLTLGLVAVAGALIPHWLARRYLESCGVALSWSVRKVALIRWILMAPLSASLGFAFLHTPLHGYAIPLTLFTSVLIALSAIDAETMYLPDLLTWPLLFGGIVFHIWTGQWQNAVIGALGALAVMYGLAYGYFVLRGREGLGLGDAKLLGALGAWLGWAALPMLLMVSATIQLVAMLCIQRLTSQSSAALPYGPALAFAGIVSMLSPSFDRVY